MVAFITHTESVTLDAFSPNWQRVISGSYENTARILDTASGEQIARNTHDWYLTSVAFSPDGMRVVSGSDDGTARVWEASSGAEIARMTHDGAVTSVAFSPDGKYVVSGSGDGTIFVWIYRPEDLIAGACSRLTRNLTRAEWQQYIGDALPYQAVYSNLPIEP